jgi:hypothetical protein
MKKTVWFAMLLLVIVGCGRQESRVEKVMEEGVEVVGSGTEPYVLPGMKNPYDLEKGWVIDLEDEDVEKAGLYQIDTFAVDDDGNIYILSVRSEEHHLFKFTPEGKFDKSFGRNGQGPGELARPTEVILIQEQELLVVDADSAKLVYFDRAGEMLREVTLNRNIPFVLPLSNGNFVVFGRIQPDMEEKYLKYPLELCDENFEPLKTLDEYRMENFRVTGRIRGVLPGFGGAAGGGMIFIGNEIRDYDIWAYDQQGGLVRKIRKKHQPLPVSDQIRERALARYNENVKSMVFFPETLPPFQTMTADEKGSLYVVTFGEGDSPGENVIDVFNPDGAFIGQLSAAVFVSPDTPIDTVAHKGRFYYIRETETGYKQLVAEKILTR